MPPKVDNVIKNNIEEVHSTDIAPKRPVYNMGKLNLDVLRKEQHWDQFCKNKVKELKVKPDPNFLMSVFDNLCIKYIYRKPILP